MADLIVGMGQQKSLVGVVRLAEGEVRKTNGAPRKVVARAHGIEVHAIRAGFEGEFDSFKIRLRAEGDLLDNIKKFAKKCPIPCSLVEANGLHDFNCLAAPGGPAATHAVIDELSALLRLPEIWRVHGEQYRREQLSLETLFRAMIKFRASDAHLFPDSTPLFRVDGQLRRSEMFQPLSAEQILLIVQEIAPEKAWTAFQEHHQCSFTYRQLGLGFARVSAFVKRGVPHCTFRYLPETVPSFESLHIPTDTMQALGRFHFGLILVTGMTGSGKSTTVAALVDWINTTSARHILSIEDPIEYVQKDKKAMVSQRELGEDIATFSEGVRGALRHDPDVLFIGEMRDTDTIRAGISAAATGHLVISTLHANTASEVVTRIVSFFDPVERDLVKLQLRDCVKCIICQRLVPKVGGGRVPALEFMFNDTKYIADNILAGDAVGIRTGMQQTLSSSFIVEEYLHKLFKQELISLEDARANSASIDIFDQMKRGTYAVPSIE